MTKKSVNVSVTVTNHGPRDVNESVLVYVQQRFRSAILPELKLLKGFAKVEVRVRCCLSLYNIHAGD